MGLNCMRMIQPNCRAQFTAADVAFAVEVLGTRLGAHQCLVQLLADGETRDLILEDDQLFHAVLERRGFPDLRYYEEVGRTQFRIAGQHPLAQRYQVDNVLLTLAERFQATRRALHDMADRLLSLAEPDFPVHALLGGELAVG